MKQLPENLRKRIEKLINLRDGAKEVGSLHEAEVAAQKLQKLLWEYNLNEGEFAGAKDRERLGIDEVIIDTDMKKSEGGWLLELFIIISKENLVTPILTSGQKGRLYFIGEPQNIEVAKYTAEQLRNRLRPIARQAYKEPENKLHYPNRNKFLRDYLWGATIGIRDKLAEHRRKAEAENPQIHGLIKLNLQKNEEYISENINIKKARSVTSVNKSAQAYFQGHAQGKAMGVSKGVAGAVMNQNKLDKG